MSDIEEFYDDATDEFPSANDLAPLANSSNPTTVGRLVAIWAKSNDMIKGENKPYPITESLTLVLDNGPDGDQYNDKIPETSVDSPVRLPLRHSTTGIQSRLGPRVEGKNKAGVPLKFRPLIGRVNTRPSTKYKKGSPAFSISTPTDADRVLIESWKAVIIGINKELESGAAADEDAEAFE